MANFDAVDTSVQAERSNFLPTRITELNLLSDTSEGYDCFAYQRFSSKLQLFMINYVLIVSAPQSIYV